MNKNKVIQRTKETFSNNLSANQRKPAQGIFPHPKCHDICSYGSLVIKNEFCVIFVIFYFVPDPWLGINKITGMKKNMCLFHIFLEELQKTIARLFIHFPINE